MNATSKQISELAAAISVQAQAIADDKVVGPISAAVRRLEANVSTLRAWVPDDRSDFVSKSATA